MGFYRDGRWAYDAIDEASGYGIAGTQESPRQVEDDGRRTFICTNVFLHQFVAHPGTFDRLCPTCGAFMRQAGE